LERASPTVERRSRLERCFSHIKRVFVSIAAPVGRRSSTRAPTTWRARPLRSSSRIPPMESSPGIFFQTAQILNVDQILTTMPACRGPSSTRKTMVACRRSLHRRFSGRSCQGDRARVDWSCRSLEILWKSTTARVWLCRLQYKHLCFQSRLILALPSPI
jgi:hypothetical protein